MTRPAPAPTFRRRPNLPTLEELEGQRIEQLRRTIRAGIARLGTARDAALDARQGKGTGAALSKTAVMRGALIHEITLAVTAVLADLFAAAAPPMRERSLDAFIAALRDAVAARTKEPRP